MVITCAIAVQEIDYTEEYMKGANNEMADAISRLCINHIAEPVQLLSAIHLLSDLSGDHLEALHMFHNSTVGNGGVDRTVGYLQRFAFTWPATSEKNINCIYHISESFFISLLIFMYHHPNFTYHFG